MTLLSKRKNANSLNPTETPAVRWRVVFYGKVQFVGFRYTAIRLARPLGLTGTVCNMPDGSVLIEAQGRVNKLRKLLMQLKSQPHIHIEEYEITEIPPVEGERGFRAIREYEI